MQHIGVCRESECGEMIAEFDVGGIDLRIVTEAPRSSSCLRFIDPYGDLVVNQLQLPVMIAELEEMSRFTKDSEFQSNIAKLVQFLRESADTHVYVRFVGD